MRKGFKFIDPNKVFTPVYDARSAFVPDQSISLRDMMLQFGFIGAERMQEVINRGFDGDEDDDLLGYDVGALDFAEVHDRMLDLMAVQNATRAIHAEPEPIKEPEPEPTKEPEPEPSE